ncbi:hypothetical protein RFI_39710 [Reticulomyxa filosa]|uniref:Uncharacterized protein n=1 Tax=Reticulomyxa filosa TaxID=46433 RepID=X6L7K5_RETFI|nr:hypothetical protein RFI_39710 [Reticulomyxa filosa]|eukprot:ETN97817.1 hypothetical protein RFI_39710 [Reticulomyxa filosa]
MVTCEANTHFEKTVQSKDLDDHKLKILGAHNKENRATTDDNTGKEKEIEITILDTKKASEMDQNKCLKEDSQQIPDKVSLFCKRKKEQNKYKLSFKVLLFRWYNSKQMELVLVEEKDPFVDSIQAKGGLIVQTIAGRLLYIPP